MREDAPWRLRIAGRPLEVLLERLPLPAARPSWQPSAACVRRSVLLALTFALGAQGAAAVVTQPSTDVRAMRDVRVAAEATAPLVSAAAPARVATDASAAGVAARAAAPVFEFAPATLPAARVGQRYGPLPLVRHDGAAAVLAIDGELEVAGLAVSDDGVLGGQAVRAGRYRVTLTRVGDTGVSAPLRQTFAPRVLSPAAEAPVTLAAPAPLPPVQVPREALNQLPALPEGRYVRSWKLGLDHIERVAAAVEGVAAQEAEAQRQAGWAPVPGVEPTAAAVGARIQQLQAALAGMLDIEYATASQFTAALAQQDRAACVKLVQAALGREPTQAESDACDAPAAATPPPASGSGRASGSALDSPATLTPRQARDELLPLAVQQAATALVVRRHTLAEARPVRWTGGGCGCVLPERESLVYGLLPFWHEATDERPLQVDFSAYERIGYLGALLNADGSLQRAPALHDEHPDGLVRALRHGTELDLVVHGSDWAPLLALQRTPRQAALGRTVDELMGTVQQPLQAWWRPWVQYALPGWPQPTHLFSGVTLHFDDMPPGEASQRWLVDLVNALVPRLEAARRGLTLQVVVRAEVLSHDDGIAQAVRLMELTGSIRPAGETGIGQGAHGRLVPRVPTRLLVLLDEPTARTKKALREALDRSTVLQNHQRVDFLNAILPLMLHPAGDRPAAMGSVQTFQFDADLAYHAWQYGGAGLWPLADAGRGAGAQATELLHRNIRDDQRLWKERWRFTHRLCDAVCPQRTGWRLLLNGLLALGGVSLALFALSRRVRATGLPMVIWMWAGLAVTGLVFWLLLTCDPALHDLSESNVPLVALFSVGLLGALWRLARRRVPAP